MAETTTITIRIPVELRDRLDRLAQVTKRSRSYLAAEALAEFVADELAVVDDVLEGLADIEAGRFVSHEQVVAESEKLFDEIYSRQAAPMADAVRVRKAATR